jgi:hypothetical protein
MQRPDARLAYSKQTREYLRRQVWRTLKQLGEEGDYDYIKLALSILLQYSDVNAQPVKESVFYNWNYSNWTRVERSRVSWDAYAGYLRLNHIL